MLAAMTIWSTSCITHSVNLLKWIDREKLYIGSTEYDKLASCVPSAITLEEGYSGKLFCVRIAESLIEVAQVQIQRFSGFERWYPYHC